MGGGREGGRGRVNRWWWWVVVEEERRGEGSGVTVRAEEVK